MNDFSSLLILFQILLIDLAMAGDNAIVVGTAASGLPASERRKVIVIGIGVATLLRITFAIFAVQLLHLVGLLLAGGLLLLWVAYAMFRDIRKPENQKNNKSDFQNSSITPGVKKALLRSALQVAAADVSMSLDNVLAVAGVARDHKMILVLGLIVSVGLMGAAASGVARVIKRYPWIAYLGLVIVLYASLTMVWNGLIELKILPA